MFTQEGARLIRVLGAVTEVVVLMVTDNDFSFTRLNHRAHNLIGLTDVRPTVDYITQEDDTALRVTIYAPL